MQKERKYKRIKLDKSFAIDINLNNELVPVLIEDISKGGAKLKCEQYIKPGTDIILKFSLNDSLKAQVRWTRRTAESKDYYVGVQFLNEWEGDILSLKSEDNIYSREFKRRVPPVDIRFYAWDTLLAGHKQQVTLLDISEGGAKLRVNIPWAEGTILNLNLKKDVMLVGEVRWRSVVKDINIKNPEYVIGVQFRKKADSKIIKEIKRKTLKYPDNIDNYNKLAMELRKENMFDDAIVNYKKAIERDKDNEILHFNLARVYLDLKKLELAITSLKKAIEIDPQFFIAKTLLEKTEEKLKS